MLAAGLPLRCVALSAPGEYDTHSDQAPALASGSSSPRIRCSRSSATSKRAASPTACSCTCGRSSAGEPRRTGRGGTDHGAAGVGFLVGTRVKGTMVGEFPGLKTGLDEDGNLKATSDFRAVYAACSSSGSARTPPQCSQASTPSPACARPVIAAPPPPPARVQVLAQEFRYTLVATDDQSRLGDHRAAQRRRRRARPAHAKGGRNAHIRLAERAGR